MLPNSDRHVEIGRPTQSDRTVYERWTSFPGQFCEEMFTQFDSNIQGSARVDSESPENSPISTCV
jgi:hypothetical protein